MGFWNIANLVFASAVGAFIGWDLFDAGVDWYACAMIGWLAFLVCRMDWAAIIEGKHFDD